MTQPTKRQRQQARRASHQFCGYRRLDISINRDLFALLTPFLEPFGGAKKPGSALVKWLDELTKSGQLSK
jgi:hypothetical protein